MDSIRKSLLHFLQDDTLRVAVVKGAWGTGKTYFWRNFFNDIRNELNFRAYSYVSLFGVGNISELQKQIFSNFEMLDKNTFTKHLEKLKPISNLLKSVDIPYLNSASAITDIVESQWVQNFLICFDDLERKESSISGSAVLGLISQLSVEKGCKVILIYNDEQLDDATTKQLNEYREKVVDLEIKYKPTIKDNLSIIWPNDCPPGVEDLFKKLDLNNIRIMHRVKCALNYFDEHIRERYPLLHPAFSYKVAVLTVFHHAYGSKLSLQEVLSTNYYLGRSTKDEEKKDLFRILEEINYLPEDQDRIIADYLVDGYVDFKHYETLLEEKNEQRRRGDMSQRYREIWRMYHSNFQSSQDDFIDAQIKFLEDHVQELSVNDIALAVKFINELDGSRDLSLILDESIDLYVSNLDRFDAHIMDYRDLDPAVVTMIKSRLQTTIPNFSITELFELLTKPNAWHPAYFPFLQRFSEDDFYSWIESNESDNCIEMLGRILERFGREDGAIIDNIKNALKRIKKRSNLDAARVNNLIFNKLRK